MILGHHILLDELYFTYNIYVLFSTSSHWKMEEQNIGVQHVAFMGRWNTHCLVYNHNYSIQWAQICNGGPPDKSGFRATCMTSGERPKPMNGPTCLSIPIITYRSKESGFGFKRVTSTTLVGGPESFSNLIACWGKLIENKNTFVAIKVITNSKNYIQNVKSNTL